MDGFAPLPVDPTLGLALRQPPAVAGTRDPAAARRTAEDFEAFFLSQVFEEMFAGLEPDALFGGGSAERTYRSLLFQEYGKAVARSGGVGLADSVQREILKLQEVANP
jgi:Rod binding domain-containing protein